MAAKIPSPESVSGPASMRAGGPMAQVDTSGLARGNAMFVGGVQDLARGFNSLSADLGAVAGEEKQRQNVSDVAAAEALWTKGSLDMGNRADTDGDWRTFDKRYGEESTKLKDAAGALIRDEETRTRFLENTELRRIATVDSIGDRGRLLSHQEDRVNFETALGSSSDLISEPSVGPVVRKKARKDVQDSIDAGVQAGLISPVEGQKYREAYLDKADEQLAINRANLGILTNPSRVVEGLGVASAMGGNDVANAAMAASGGIVPLELGVAEMAASALGDEAFPSDPKLAEAYLKDPEINARYAGAALDILTDRYKGDLTAAVIASAPDGGTELADKWVKSKHDESVLPASVKKYYKDVMGRVAPERDMTPMPIIAEPGVDIANVDVAVLDRFEKVQTAFGQQFKIISGYRDPGHNAEVGGATKSQHIDRRAIDIDVSKLSEADRIRLIETASAFGFTGVGVYDNTLHLDTGERRAWGPDHHADSVPGWAQDVIARHTAGDITEVAPGAANVAPEYQALSFDQRMQLHAKAKAAMDQQSLDTRAGIEVAVNNAPAAIMQFGTYDGRMPEAEDFVRAYGAADGIERYRQFEAGVDTAEAAYGMRTMPADDIASMVESYAPKSQGDAAAVELKRFETISQAAAATLKARNEDPAGYAAEVFPAVKNAWQNVGQGQEGLSQAIAITALAQEQLGVEKQELLPKQMSDKVAATFNDKEAPPEERIGALTSMVFATQDEEQQQAIFKQLVASGVPAHAQGAMDALSRGDTGAAMRLFRAATIDPKDLPGQLPDNIKAADIDQKISATLLDEGQIGDVIYGIGDGRTDGLERLATDGALITNAVKLMLIDHSASGIDDAIQKVAKDMWGDVRPVTGKGWGNKANVQIVLPNGTDDRPYRAGFDALLATVGQAASASMTQQYASAAVSAGPTGPVAGLVEPGNVDLTKRPVVKMPDGNIATVRSISFEEDGIEILVPSISPDGKVLSDSEAIDLYHQSGQFLGKFENPEAATAYAESLHKAQDGYYSGAGPRVGTSDAAILAAGRDQRVQEIMTEGYFAPAGDDFVFVDPMTGQAVGTPDGDPLVFTKEDVLQAGAAVATPEYSQAEPKMFGFGPPMDGAAQ